MLDHARLESNLRSKYSHLTAAIVNILGLAHRAGATSGIRRVTVTDVTDPALPWVTVDGAVGT